MRDIKFRAWLKNAKVMDYPKSNKSLFMWYEDENQPMEIMQFTGLKDRNGKEVYEGDLLLVCETRICEVIFHEYAACWDIEPRKILSSQSIRPVSPASWQYHAEVIGNIYENPELLTQQEGE